MSEKRIKPKPEIQEQIYQVTHELNIDITSWLIATTMVTTEKMKK